MGSGIPRWRHSSTSSANFRVFVWNNGCVPLLFLQIELDESTLTFIYRGDFSLSSSPLRRRRKHVKPWYIHSSYTHSHVGVVRALFVDERKGLIVTGGEDAKLNIWRDATPPPLALASLYTQAEVDGEEGIDDEDVGMDVDEASQKPLRIQH
ncbi:hypothetical protein FA13DRAFT_592274 [Coprinellus micaceus]|uniref:Uncharacterized protein n=1 Tax=Coprinellus micaceus TaxID=71717 RepID=A0A4Y7SAF6_COPMI|nr:hypothetical protein FA13DRAFT_592274 [Coprinellus micaceus]